MAETLIIAGDVSKAEAALAQLDRRTDASVAKVAKLAKGFAAAEAEAEGLADEAAEWARELGKVSDVARKQAEETKRVVRLRELENDEIEHQIVLMRTLGLEQAKINAAEARALVARKAALEVAGDFAGLTKLRRQQEIAAAQAVTLANQEATTAQRVRTEAATKSVELLESQWQKVALVVVALVAGITAADAAMNKAFGQRNILANLPFAIDEARESTLGLVEDMHLSRIAIEAQRLKVVGSAEDFGKLTAAATKLGLSVGKDATSSVESLVGALGRGETELLDNLGITLRAGEAQRLYAEQLGISTKALTEDQKAEAFRVIGLQKAVEAAEKVNVTVNEQEKAWTAARQQYDRLIREELPEATKRMGGLWEAVGAGAKLIEDVAPIVFGYIDGIITGLKPAIAVVSFFGAQIAGLARGADAIGGILGRATDRVSEFASVVGDWISDSIAGDAAAWVSETASAVVSLADNGLDRLTDSIEEQLPFTADLADAWDEVTAAVFGTEAAIGTLGLGAALGDLLDAGRDLAKEQKASDAQRVASLKDGVAQAEFAVRLAEAQQRPAAELERLYVAQNAAKLELLRTTGDQAKVEAAQQDEQVRLAAAAAKRGGGGRGPSRADRLRAIGEIQLEQWSAELAHLEIVTERRGNSDRDAAKLAGIKLGLAVQELELERQVLEVTRTKNIVERQRNEARRVAIDGEIEILNLEAQITEQARERETREAAGEKALVLMDREIERLQSLGVATQMLERDRQAASRAQVEAFGEAQEIAAFEHEAEVAANELRKEREIEAAERQLAAFNRDADLATARGEQVEDLASRRLAIEAQVAVAEGNNDRIRATLHKREVARIKEQVNRRKAAASASSSLLSAGQSLFSTVVNVAVKDEKKREKAALRARGVEALARGALETVEAVASFASFNFVQGALHTAAAAVAFTQGAVMIAGRIPGQGGATAGGGGGGAQDHQVQFQDRPGSGRDRPSTPTSAEALINARGGGAIAETPGEGSGGGTVINFNGTVIAGDSGDLLNDMTTRQQKKAWGS